MALLWSYFLGWLVILRSVYGDDR